MKYEEAIKVLQTYGHNCRCCAKEGLEASKIAIEVLNKQIPFTPETNNLKVGLGRCKCGAEFLDKLTNYCGNCGQRILWEVEE